MKTKIRVLIVDDHAMMRLGLAEAILGDSHLALVGEAANGEEAMELYRRHRPDVVVMDFQIPGADGAETTARLRTEFPEARVVVLSVFEGEENIWRAVEAGAMGYVPKSARIDAVLEAIRQVFGGGAYFPPAIAAKLAARRTRGGLTPSELQVLREIVAGRSNKEIAAALYMSGATVKLRISNLLVKLGVADRTQAAIEAVRRGIVNVLEP
jgi:DNA-binding NarL/FixJ family response regulator